MKVLTQKDYAEAAKTLGWSTAAIKAVAEVESAGVGFLPSGEPKILFERHIFFRLLTKAGISAKWLQARNPDIVNSKTGGYLGGAAEHKRLEKAITIHRELALQSASWGKFQIMGFNYEACGYENLQDFINDMYKDEAGQLKTFVGFIKHHPKMVRAGQELDWTTFARLFNGPAFAKYQYDTKLAKAYLKYLH